MVKMFQKFTIPVDYYRTGDKFTIPADYYRTSDKFTIPRDVCRVEPSTVRTNHE